MRFCSSRLFLVSALLAASPAAAAEIFLAQGSLVGEVTATSAILQTRLTRTPVLEHGDLAGAGGIVRFELAETDSFANAWTTPWLVAHPDADFIVKSAVRGLRPATMYFYRALYGAASDAPGQRGATGKFRTLPAAAAPAEVRFVLLSCLNYAFFQHGERGQGGYTGDDKALGYPALDAITKIAPDFVIFDGDCVYYDHPVATRAKTLPELRRKWHEQYGMPRFLRLFAQAPTYWLKDDHDYRINDSDPTGDYEPSHALGIATFREQVPIVDSAQRDAVTYRTHRMGRDLQLWFVEGRDYRSPNRMPDGPGKSIWGAEQRAWLQRTLRESDATYKILVSPSPMVGPDDASKRDNHVNPAGFREEGESFFAWLKASGVPPGKFFVICGDRHWKYHSTHPSGYEELTSGALNRENSRLGRAPGDAKSTDPKSQVKQLYTDQPASGGFLHVLVQPGAAGREARIEFTHFDDRGRELYRHAK